MRKAIFIRVAAAAVLAAACGGDGTGPTPPTPTPTQLSFTSPPPVTAQSGVVLATQPVVRLRDKDNKLVAKAGVVITASITGAGANLSNATATTDGSGTAAFTALTVTGITGTYTLHFAGTGLTTLDAPAALTLSAGVPSQLVVATAPSVTGTAGSVLATQPSIQLRDASGNAASQAGVTVTASLVSGGATITNATAVTNASGLATFTGLALSGTAGSYTFRFSAPGLGSVDAAAPTVLSAGAASQIALVTQPATTAVNGAVFGTQPVVQLRDAFGNNATQAGVTVIASVVTGPAGSAIAGDTAITNAGGTATFTALKITGTVGNYSLRFSSPPLASVVSAAATALTPGAAAGIAFSTAPSTSAANGVAFATQPVIQVQDQSGNAVAQAGVVVTASITGGTGTLTNATATTDAAGKATFSGLAVTGTAGVFGIQYATASLGTIAGPNLALTPGAAASLVMTTQPAFTAANGGALSRQPVLRLQDQSGNNVSQAGVVVTATVVSGAATLANATATTGATGIATFAGLAITATTGSYTLRFSALPLPAVDASAPTVLSAGAATQLVLTTPPPATAQNGVAMASIVAQLADVSGNPVATAGVVVTASVIGGGPVLTNLAATTNASGVATFNALTMTGTAGSYTLRFSASGVTSVDAPIATALGAGAAAALRLATEPDTAGQSGIALARQPVVQLLDGSGNAVAQAGIVVTASLASGTGTLGNVTATTDGAGQATFAGLAISGVIGSYTLAFGASGLTGVQAAAATILSAGAASQLHIVTQPSASAQSGIALVQQPVVRLEDASGNPVATAGVTVTASLVSGSVTLANATINTNASGVATFANLTLTGVAGSYQLQFDAAGLTGATAAAPTVLGAGAAAAITLTTQPSASASSGAVLASQPAVQLRDGAGNAVPQAGVVVTASVVGGGATLGNATATTNASGLATFSGLSITGSAGTYTLRFSTAGVPDVDAAAPTALSAGPATQLTMVVEPSATAQNGLALATQPAVQLLDAANNAKPQAGVVVTASLVSGSLVIGNATATTDPQGTATFSGLTLTGTAGSYTLQFTSPGLATATAAAPTVLGAGAATQITMETQPSTTAQSGVFLAQEPVVRLRDVSGNVVSQAGVLLTASVVSGSVTLTNATATTNAGGVAQFSGLTLTGTAGSYTIQVTGAGLTAAVAAAPTVLSAGAATKILITTQPSTTASAGVVLATQPVARLLDASNNPVAQAGVTLGATLVSGSLTLAGPTATTDAAGIATWTALAMHGTAGSYTFRFTGPSLASADAAAPTVLTGGAAQSLVVATQPAASAQNAVALPTQPAVQLLDQFSNTSPTAGVVVSASVSGPGGVLSNATATSDATGLATFSGLTITGTAGSYNFQFAATGLGTVNAAAPTVTTAGAATKLGLTTQPDAFAQNGVAMTIQPVVQLRDVSGNAVAQAGVLVTASLVSGSASVTNATATTDASGAATFSGLTLTGLVGTYQFQFAAGGLASVTAIGNTSLNAGAATTLVVATQPSTTASSGVALATQPAIQLHDASGNNVPQAGVLVTATLVSGGVTIGAASAATDAAGLATFSALSLTGATGSYTFRFGAAGLTSIDAAAPTVLGAGAASALVMVTEPGTAAQSRIALATQPVLRLRDASGNNVPQAGIVVTASVVSGSVTLGSATATTDGAGVATFGGLSIGGSVGSYTLRFTAPSLPFVDAAAPTVLSAGAADHLFLAANPSTAAQSGVALAEQPWVLVRDVDGNVVDVDGLVITASLVSGSPTITNGTATTTDGLAVFNNLALAGASGTYTFRFSAAGVTSVDAPNATVLGPQPPDKLVMAAQPSTSATSGLALAQQPVVQLKDGFNADLATAGVTITASVVSGSVVLANATAITNASGTATFSGLTLTGLAGSYQLQFSATGYVSATASAATSLAAGAASQLVIEQQPGAGVAVNSFLNPQPWVRLRDAAGNDVAQAGVVITASLVSAPGVSVFSNTATTDGTGLAKFTSISLSGPTGSYTFRFSASGVTDVDAASPTQLTAGIATQLAMVTQPSTSTTSGAVLATQPAVRLLDAVGNFRLQAGYVINATVVNGSAAITNASTTTDANGIATFTGITLTGAAGSNTLRFSGGGLVSVDAAAPTVILAGGAAKLALATQPSTSAQNGAALAQQPSVQITDGSGNPVSSPGVTITASVVSGSAVIANATALTGGTGLATFSGLSLTALAGSYTLRFSGPGLTAIDAASATTLSAGAATQLALLTQPSTSATSGAALATQPVVRLRDSGGNDVSQAGVLVTATVVSGSVSIGNATATTNGSGVATFSGLSLTGAAASYTLRFGASGVSAVDASAPTVLGAGGATKLSLTTQPSGTAQNAAALAQQPVVQLRDASDNPVATAGITVTASVVSGSVVFANATALTDVNGAATFSGLALTATAGSYTLRFSAGGLTSIDAAAPTVLGAGAATQLVLTTQPSTSATSGSALAAQPVARLRDSGGNNVSQAGVVVTATVVSGSVAIGNATATTDASGIAAFSGLSLTGAAASYTLRFSASGVSSIDAASPTALAAGGATKLSLTTQPSTTAQNAAALAQQPVVQLRDASDNPVATAGISVSASVVSGSVVLANATVLTDVNGTATFSGLALTAAAGSYTLRFSAGGLTSVDAAAPTVLSAGAATQLVLATQPSISATSGVALATQPVARLRDSGNNDVAQAGVLVTATVVSGSVVIGNATATTDGSGVATFSGLTLTASAGSYTLRFSAGGVSSVDAAAPTVLSAAAATKLALTTQPSTTASVAAALATQPAVQLQDGSSNPVAQAGVLVTASVVSGSVTIANNTATTDGSGVATFSGLALTATAGSYTLRFTASGLTGADAAAPTVLGAGAASQLAMVTQPSAAAVNATALATQPAVRLRDVAGNDVAASGVTITATAPGASVASATANTDAAGVATFSGLAITGTIGTYTLHFASGSLTAVDAGTGTTISAGAAASIAITTPPQASVASGVAMTTPPAVFVTDVSGNAVAGVQVYADVPGASPSIQVTNGSQVTDAGGAATFTGLTITAPANGYSLRFCVGACNSASIVAGSPTSTFVTAGALANVTLTTEPSTSVVNGAALGTQPVAHLTDAAGNPVSGATVTATTAAGVVITNGTAISDASGNAIFSGLTLTGTAGSYTLHFASGAASDDAAAATNVTASAAQTLTIDQQPSTSASNGVVLAVQPIVTVTDMSGNPVAGVNVTASAAGATSLSNATSTTNGAGVATFSGLAITGTAPALYTLHFQAGAASADGNQTTLAPGTATTIALTTQPSTTANNGLPLAQQPVAHVTDGTNPVPGVIVTASVVSGSVTFIGGTAATDGSGNAAFTNLEINGSPASYTLRFTIQGASGPVFTDAAAPTSLAAGAASALEIQTQPSVAAQSGVALATQPVVRIVDAGGLLVTTGTYAVTASVVSGSATLANATVISSGGIATFSGLSVAALVGNYTLVFTAGGLTSATAAAATAISTGPASQLTLTVEPPSTAIADTIWASQPVVQVRDGAGNPVSAGGVNVTLGAQTGSPTFTGTTTVATNGAGTATFTGIAIRPQGSFKLQFSASGLATADAADSIIVAKPIANNTPTTISGNVVSAQTVVIQVLPTDTLLRIVLDTLPGATGDADLFVRYGAAPDLGNDLHDCFPNLAGNNEVCTFRSSNGTLHPGYYYISVYAFFAFTNVKLTVIRE